MAKKVLGQYNPGATTPWNLYTVPSGKQAVVSSLTVCNLSATSATFRISVRPAAGNQTNAMYIAYDVTVAGNDTTVMTIGITMAATDVLTVYASSANVAFTAFGDESAA